MAISVRAVGSPSSGTGAITPPLPSGAAANDILVTLIETADEAITVPTGWAHATNSPIAITSTTRLNVVWRRMQAGDTAPGYPDAGDHQVGRMIAFRGVITTEDPWTGCVSSTDTVSNTSLSIPISNTTTANEMVLAAAATPTDVATTSNVASFADASLVSCTERMDNWIAGGNGGGITCATGIKATAGAVSNATATLTNGDVKVRWSGALKPAPDPVEPAYANADAVTVTTENFTPTANSLLVAICGIGNGSGTAGSPTGAISDSLTGSWTKLHSSTSASNGASEVYARDVGASPASMTVTYASTGGTWADVGVKVVCLTGMAGVADQTETNAAHVTYSGTAYTASITPKVAGSQCVIGLGRATGPVALTVNAATTSTGTSQGGSGDTVGTGKAAALTPNPPASVTLGWTNVAAATNNITVVEIIPPTTSTQDVGTVPGVRSGQTVGAAALSAGPVTASPAGGATVAAIGRLSATQTTDAGTVAPVTSAQRTGSVTVTATVNCGTMPGIRSAAVTARCVLGGTVDCGAMAGIPSPAATGSLTATITVDVGTLPSLASVVGVGPVSVAAGAVDCGALPGVTSAQTTGSVTALATVDCGTTAGVASVATTASVTVTVPVDCGTVPGVASLATTGPVALVAGSADCGRIAGVISTATTTALVLGGTVAVGGLLGVPSTAATAGVSLINAVGLAVAGVASGQTIAALTVTATATVAVPGVASLSEANNPVLLAGAVVAMVAGIPSTETIGAAGVTLGQDVVLFGVASLSEANNPVLLAGAVAAALAGVPSRALVPALAVSAGAVSVGVATLGPGGVVGSVQVGLTSAVFLRQDLSAVVVARVYATTAAVREHSGAVTRISAYDGE